MKASARGRARAGRKKWFLRAKAQAGQKIELTEGIIITTPTGKKVIKPSKKPKIIVKPKPYPDIDVKCQAQRRRWGMKRKPKPQDE